MNIADGMGLQVDSPQEPELDVAALIVKVQARDMQALAQLYALFSVRLKRYVKRFVHDEQCAEDVVHDVFLRIWRYAASFDARKIDKPESWIFQIARNQALTQAVLLSKSISVDSFDAIDGQPERPWIWEEFQDVSAIDKISSQSKAFKNAIAGLSPGYRQTIYLRYYREMTHPQIAEILDIPLGTAKTWLRRALLQLRRSLRVSVESTNIEDVEL